MEILTPVYMSATNLCKRRKSTHTQILTLKYNHSPTLITFPCRYRWWIVLSKVSKVSTTGKYLVNNGDQAYSTQRVTFQYEHLLNFE